MATRVPWFFDVWSPSFVSSSSLGLCRSLHPCHWFVWGAIGRWTWIRLRGHNRSHVWIYSAYRPVCNPRDLGSVWNQHLAFFSAAHPPRTEDPRQAFLMDLRQDLQQAYDAGDQIFLTMDAKEPLLWTPLNPIAESLTGLSLVDLHLDRHDRATARRPTTEGLDRLIASLDPPF